MLTVGVDLAATPQRTAMCSIDWSASLPVVCFHPDTTDDGIIALATVADKVGIDCPVGWPDPFIDAVTAHAAGHPWPGRDRQPDVYRRELSYRLTDEHVRADVGLIPLSVSTDRIGVTAMRCASILDVLQQQGVSVERDGSGRIAEVYPAAGLKVWGFDNRRYKRAIGIEIRAKLVTAFLAAAPWLVLADAEHQRCLASDDHFDALVAALLARAVAVGLTIPCPSGDLERVRREGWIHVPRPDALSGLVRAA